MLSQGPSLHGPHRLRPRFLIDLLLDFIYFRSDRILLLFTFIVVFLLCEWFCCFFGIKILSNGKYTSVMHRAAVNSKATRISIAMQHGPALDAVVSPASELVDNDGNPPVFRAIKYEKYVELNQSNKLDGKSCLEGIRIN